MTDRLLTVAHVAERLSVSERTIYRLLESGALTGLRIRGALRVTAPSLEHYLRCQVAQYRLENGICDYE